MWVSQSSLPVSSLSLIDILLLFGGMMCDFVILKKQKLFPLTFTSKRHWRAAPRRYDGSVGIFVITVRKLAETVVGTLDCRRGNATAGLIVKQRGLDLMKLSAQRVVCNFCVHRVCLSGYRLRNVTAID